AAQHRDLAGGVRATPDVADLLSLDMHAGHEHDVGPGKIGFARRSDVLVDEADRPGLRHVGGDQQQPLRRHESFDAVHQLVGVLEGAEGGRVAWEYAQHPPLILHRNRTTHRNPRNLSPMMPPLPERYATNHNPKYVIYIKAHCGVVPPPHTLREVPARCR